MITLFHNKQHYKCNRVSGDTSAEQKHLKGNVKNHADSLAEISRRYSPFTLFKGSPMTTFSPSLRVAYSASATTRKRDVTRVDSPTAFGGGRNVTILHGVGH